MRISHETSVFATDCGHGELLMLAVIAEEIRKETPSTGTLTLSANSVTTKISVLLKLTYLVSYMNS